MYYLIREKLEPCGEDSFLDQGVPYVAVLTGEEWRKHREDFDMGIDLERDGPRIRNTKAEVNDDSLTGTFRLRDREGGANERVFSFALDEKGVVFIDDSGYAEGVIEAVRASRRWRLPSLARFLYDFLERLIEGDLEFLEDYEDSLDDLEEEMLAGESEDCLAQVSRVRNHMRGLRLHYEQLMDMAQELQENENGFFHSDEERYFKLFFDRVNRLRDKVTAMRDHAIQIRELYQSELDLKLNRTMSLLTVIATIFMPLTLIAGWYGMNFRYMPELDWPWAYPAVFVLCVAIVVACLWYFRKKKWL